MNSHHMIPQDLTSAASRALEEDMGSGDLTAALIPESQQLRLRTISREPAVVAGQPYFDEVFRQLDPQISIQWAVCDGESVKAGDLLCTLHGRARPLLSGERTALNFLQTLSATATRAQAYVRAVAGTGVTILDTRKTLPGLRQAQKYAVRCGGASNHRMGLYDAFLIKENHIAAAGNIAAAVDAARAVDSEALLEVEVENLTELDQAVAAGAERALLDNFSLENLQTAVRRHADNIELEASGNVSLESVRAIAETGVHFISTGDLTKSIRAIDLSMRFSEDSSQ